MRTSLILAGAVVLVLGSGGALAGQAAAAPGGPLQAGQAAPKPTTGGGQAAEPLRRVVSLDLEEAPLGRVLDEIDRQAKLGLAYTPRVVPLDRKITIRASRIAAGAALERVLEGTGVTVEVTPDGTVTLVKRAETTDAGAGRAAGHVAGWVRDTAGRPLAGAEVNLRGTGFRAEANDSGLYVLREVPAGSYTLHVRLIGYVPATREIVVPEGDAVRADLMLTPSVTRLTEVVTTATGMRRRIELGNDVVVVNVDSIVQTQPVTSLTQLLEARVPGLVVQQTTGAPGDPRRLRLRGAASAYRSNDPIVILDGIRVYSAQSDARSGNLAARADGSPTPAPSPLDQIDPHSIETVEVLKGPSASTLYGADAANGVIVITTKKGRAGPTTWTMNAERGLTQMPGRYPEHYFRWGHDHFNDAPRWCPTTDLKCTADSLVRYQPLNDPELTPLGQGHRTAVTAGVSGGSAALQYALTASVSDEVGILKLPGMAERAFRESQGSAPPDWMRRPHQYTQFSGSSRVTAQLGRTADVSLTTMFSRSDQQRSSLEGQLGGFMYTYVDPATGLFHQARQGTYMSRPDLLSGFYERTTAVATTFRNGLSLNWRPLAWLSTSSDVGFEQVSRDDEALQPRGYSSTFDSTGHFFRGTGNSVGTTANARATATAPTLSGFKLRLSAGLNYVSMRTADSRIGGGDIPQGATSPTQAADESFTDNRSEVTTFGWYVEPAINYKRLFISTALRWDGGNAFRTQKSLVRFPKVGVSYVISDEPFFPFKSLFNQVQLRAAYGQAGVQPGPADHLRLYGARRREIVDSQAVDATLLRELGNVDLRPERSAELEGGLTASLLDDRMWLSVTGYRKTRNDALMQVPLPPSVYGENVAIFRNVGAIRNTGFEVSLGGELVRSDAVTWSANLGVGGNRNTVLSLGPGVEPFSLPSGGALSRVQAGYPLFGIWARPILGYTDANGDGVLNWNIATQQGEVQVGDSAAYMGPSTPDYEASLFTGVSLFRGALRIDAGFQYQHGLTQINATMIDRAAGLRALNDPNATSGEVAGLLVMTTATSGLTPYAAIQRVSMLRFNSLSIAYALSPALARRMGARAATVSLQGTNLALFSNYRGKDPNVNAYPTGNGILDNGQLPAPRHWQVRVSLQY